jgi:hypothetical protein
MNWDAIGAIGEVVGAVAVVATIGYLALQIRQNTHELRASSFRDVFIAYSNARRSTLENPDVSELHFKALQQPDEMTGAETYRLEQLYTELTWATYQLNAAIAEGFMESRLWEPSKGFLTGHLKSEAGRSWWARSRAMFDENFAEEITESISDSG